MSDLSITRGSLELAMAQPGVAAYFDPAVLALERERIFTRAPTYIGHEAAVPNPGDFHALPQEREGRALVRTAKGVELLSNVCRHRQAVMLRGRGNLAQQKAGHAGGNIVCPLHRWTYSGANTPPGQGPAGQLLGVDLPPLVERLKTPSRSVDPNPRPAHTP